LFSTGKVVGGQNELHLNLEDIEDYETDSDDSEYSASERKSDNASVGKSIDEDKLEKKNKVVSFVLSHILSFLLK
jgi:hypothetical protein